MENTQLKPTNLNEIEEEQFYKVYRILTADLLELKNFITHQKRQVGLAEQDISNLAKIISIAEKEEDEGMKDFVSLLQSNMVNTRSYVDNMTNQVEDYENKLKRSEDFLDELKSDIKILDDEGNVEVGEKLLFLIRYLHSLGHIMEPEEKEKVNQKLQQ
jgi:hypothetical protein